MSFSSNEADVSVRDKEMFYPTVIKIWNLVFLPQIFLKLLNKPTQILISYISVILFVKTSVNALGLECLWG